MTEIIAEMAHTPGIRHQILESFEGLLPIDQAVAPQSRSQALFQAQKSRTTKGTSLLC
jgi:hypothetical protein